MSKVVSIRLNDHVYNVFKKLASQENQSLSKFIATAALRYVEDHGMVDEFEQAALDSDKRLRASINHGVKDYQKGKGRFISFQGIPHR